MTELFSILDSWTAGWPPILTAVATLTAGLALAFALRFATKRGLKWLRFQSFSDRSGLTEFLRKGGAKYTPIGLAGVLVYWGTLAAVLIRISKILDITVIQELTQQIRVIAPSAIAASLIFIVGMVIVAFLATFIMTIARNAAVPNARAISRAIRFLGFGIVTATALDQIGIGKTILGPMVLMTFGALVFGLALAFGLGCKDLARSAMEGFLRELKEREQGTKGPDLEG